MNNTATRECPSCGCEITHKGKRAAYYARRRAREGRICYRCSGLSNRSAFMDRAKTKEFSDKKNKSLIGRKQTGKCKAGEAHFLASSGYLRGPNGVLYRFNNLSHFVRENEHLFLTEDVKWRDRKGHKGLRCRALSGLQGIMPTKKKPMGSWKGWTVASMVESICFNGGDPLDRNKSLDRKRPII